MKIGRIQVHFIYFFALFYFIFFSTFTYLKWHAHTPSLDYHAYLQMYWNTANGDVLMYNRSSETQYSMFSAHFSPFLLMIFPAYLILNHPLTLYFVFGFVISLSFVPLYFFALEKLKSKFSAWLVVLAFFLYFPFSWTHRHGFAEEAFATPLLFLAFYSLHKNKPWPYVIFSFLTLSLRINMVIPVFLLGVYSIIKNKSRKHGVFVCCLSLFWLYYALNIIYPKYTEDNTRFYVYGFFGDYGNNLHEIVINMLSNPAKLLQTLTSELRVKYMNDLFGSVLFLPFLAPDILFIGAPVLLINMLASYTRLGSSWTYYHSSSLPFIWLALIVTLQRIGLLWERLSKNFRAKINKELIINTILIVILVRNFQIIRYTASGQYYPLSEAFNTRIYERNNRDELIDKILTTIPKTNSVAAQHSYLEHTAERKWQFPTSNFNGYYPDIVLYDTWASSGEFKSVPENSLYSKIWEGSFFFLYTRQDLLKIYDIKDFAESAYKNYNENFEYFALATPVESFFSYSSLEPQITININEKYKLAQRLDMQKENPRALKIAVEKENIGGPNALLSIGKKHVGNLKVEIVEGEDFKANYKVVHSNAYKYESLSHKVTLLNINVEDVKIDKSKTYWIMVSLDSNKKSKRETFNNYKVYLGAPNKDQETNENFNVYYTLDAGKKWSATDYPDKRLSYELSYGKPVVADNKEFLDDGTFVSSGTPEYLKSRLEQLLNYESNYKSVAIIGTVTERL